MINKKKIILLCTLVMTFSNIGMSDEPKSQPPKDSPVVVRRKNQTLCGHDSVYVLLRLFNKDIDERKFQETLYNEGEEYSSFEDLRRIIDSIGLYSLCVKGDKWHKILSDAVGIGYRGNPDELIGDFYLFEKSGNKILLFLPPDKIFIVNANKFITRTNLGHALLVFKTQNGKYWALVKLVVGHYFFIILSVGAFIFAIYMILISWSDKKKKIKLVYGCIILLVACLTLLYSFIRFYRTPIKDDLMVVAPKNSIDLGCGNYGEEKDFEIPIKNVGKKPILINKAFSSCSCVSLNVIENVVKPNEIYKLKGLYKYPKSGDRNAHIYLIYNNGDSATKIILSGRNCKMATVNKKRLYFGQIQQNVSASKHIRLRCFIDKDGYYPPLKCLRTSASWLNAVSEEIEEQRFKGFKSYRITVSISGDIAPLGIFEEKVYIYLDDPDAKEIEIGVYVQLV